MAVLQMVNKKDGEDFSEQVGQPVTPSPIHMFALHTTTGPPNHKGE